MKEYINPAIHQMETFSNIVNVESEFDNRQFFNCIFQDCQFKRSNLSNNDFINCHFIKCDFYHVKVNGSGFQNAFFNNCKIISVDFSKCNRSLFSFEFSNCKLNYSNFQGASMTTTIFRNCSLKRVNFRGADLSVSLFENCNLIDAKFENSILEKTDFRSAYNFNIDPNLNRVKNALFLDDNLSGLLYRLDVDIRESKSYSEIIFDTIMRMT